MPEWNVTSVILSSFRLFVTACAFRVQPLMKSISIAILIDSGGSPKMFQWGLRKETKILTIINLSAICEKLLCCACGWWILFNIWFQLILCWSVWTTSNYSHYHSKISNSWISSIISLKQFLMWKKSFSNKTTSCLET